MTEMTSRERVWAALNHQEPDRVPLDIGGGASTTLVVECYERLRAHWGSKGETRLMSKAFRLAALDEETLLRLGSDCRPIGLKPPANARPAPASAERFVDAWGIGWRRARHPTGYYWEVERCPLAEATIDDLDRYPWPDPLDPGYTAGLGEEVRELHRATPYALMADGGFKSFWELGYMLRGLPQLLMDLVADPAFVTALMEKLFELNAAGTRRFLEEVGPYIQVFRTADDLATQSGLLISPETYRAVLKPFYRRYLDLVHSLTEAKVFYHSCGRVNDLLDDLSEIGVEAINPVQVSAMGDTAALKARFGARLTFWGGIDTQHVLPHGSPAEVEAEVRQRIRDLAPGGGFVAAPVHNIQPDVPPENIEALARAVRRYGRYPLRPEGPLP